MSGCGIYYLWDGERVQYIGQSRNVEKRLRAHAHGNIPFIQAFFDECDPAELDVREAAAIRELRPVLNERNATLR